MSASPASVRARPPDRGRDSPPLFKKLRPGPGLDRDQVAADQRLRLQRALVQLVAEQGYDAVRVRSVAHLAGVSTKTFYSHFSNLDDCLAATFDTSIERALAAARGSGQQPDWEGETRARIRSLMEAIAASPDSAQVVLIEALAADRSVQSRLTSATRRFERLLAETFAAAPVRLVAPKRLLTGIVGGVARMVRTTLLTGRAAELPALADPICDWLLALPDGNLLLLREGALVDRSAKAAAATAPALVRATGPYGDDRSRIFNAVAKLVSRERLPKLTVPRIRAEAGVSRKRFDACFAGVSDCFLATLEALATSAAARVERQVADAPSWESRICRELEALSRQIAVDRKLLQPALVDLQATGRDGILERDRLISCAAAHLRAAAPPDKRPEPLFAEASIAAVWSVAEAEITAGRALELPRMAPFLTYLVLAPAIGSAASLEGILRRRHAPPS